MATGGARSLPPALQKQAKIAKKAGELWRGMSEAQREAWKGKPGKGNGYMKWVKAEGRSAAIKALGM